MGTACHGLLLISKPMAKVDHAGPARHQQPQNQDEAWIVGTVQKLAQKAGIGIPVAILKAV